MSFNTDNYREQGGDTWNIGGALEFDDNPMPKNVDFTIGSESSSTVNVALQLKGSTADDLTTRGAVEAYLTTDGNGDSVIGTAPTQGVSIGTDGLLLQQNSTDKHFRLISESDGDIDIDIKSTAGQTMQLAVILPHGLLAVSDDITFTT